MRAAARWTLFLCCCLIAGWWIEGSNGETVSKDTSDKQRSIDLAAPMPSARLNIGKDNSFADPDKTDRSYFEHPKTVNWTESVHKALDNDRIAKAGSDVIGREGDRHAGELVGGEWKGLIIGCASIVGMVTMIVAGVLIHRRVKIRTDNKYEVNITNPEELKPRKDKVHKWPKKQRIKNAWSESPTQIESGSEGWEEKMWDWRGPPSFMEEVPIPSSSGASSSDDTHPQDSLATRRDACETDEDESRIDPPTQRRDLEQRQLDQLSSDKTQNSCDDNGERTQSPSSAIDTVSQNDSLLVTSYSVTRTQPSATASYTQYSDKPL